ncbi:MAG: hypothetical protein AAGU11_06235 [Syntrophobacteraceae bacterium]
MRLICPSCSAIASMEAWANDANVRQVIDIISKLPGLVASRTPAYLALFRKGPKGLSWPRALKIVSELQQLVSPGTVHWEGGEERPAPPQLWADMMDRMIARSWSDPLDDNNYLRKVVWSESKPLAVKAEFREREDAGRRYFQAASDEPRRKTCWTCASRGKPPKSCLAGHKPIGGNDNLGCGKWLEKTASVGEIVGNIVSDLHEK